MASVTTREEPNNSPLVVASIVVMALAAMLVLAYNLFVQPDRATHLNPPGKYGSRSGGAQSAPAGAMNNGATATTN
ncbi:MAG: hypothetical protein SFU56_04835 [Capsulimonadales bacterium]|nr:hypothetical protein [Capsulimonadales bacterium]